MFRTYSSKRRGQEPPLTPLPSASGSARPQPLHIVKRSSLKMDAEPTPGSRKSSAGTDESAPEPPGGDRPLTVAKRRVHPDRQVFRS